MHMKSPLITGGLNHESPPYSLLKRKMLSQFLGNGLPRPRTAAPDGRGIRIFPV